MKLLNLILTVFLLSFTILPATIEGYVYDKETSEPLIGCNIHIWKTPKGATTNVEGNFKIENVSPGKHILRLTFLAYSTIFDTVEVEDADQILNLTYQLEVCKVWIDTVSEIEDYHRYLKRTEPTDILEIVIDSIGTDKGRVIAYSTFYNMADTPVYVISDYDIVKMVNPIIENSHGLLIGRNAAFCPTGEKVNPSSSDFLVIPSHGSIKYIVFFTLYGFHRYPVDTYKIRLSYKYTRRERLPGICHDPEMAARNMENIFYYYNMAFRGDVMSSNYLFFNNKEMVEEYKSK